MTSPDTRHRARRPRPVLVAHAALTTALLACAGASGVSGDQAEPAAAQRPDGGAADSGEWEIRAADGSSVPPSAWHASPPEPAAPRDADTALALALADLPSAPGTRLSVAVLDLATGTHASYGSAAFDTASIVKVNVLAALLLQAQDEGRELTASERRLASEMIRRSDNDATDALWRRIGGAEGLDAANARLGLTGTVAGRQGLWGLTQTTSTDQITLLRAIFAPDSELSPASRAYIQELMATVVPGQRWGVSAAADGGFALKNGWLPRSQTGLWDVNSIGWVTAGGHPCLVAVVSAGHGTQQAGIAAVEAAARSAVAVVTGRAGDPGA